MTASSRQPVVFFAGIALCFTVFTLHHSLAWLRNGGDYTAFAMGRGVSDEVSDQTYQYVSASRLVARAGRWFVEVTAERGTVINAYPVLPPALLGGLSKVTGSLGSAWALVQGTSSAVIWSFAFLIAGLFLTSPWARFCFAWAATLFPFGPRNMLLVGWQSYLQPLELTRIASPCLSYAMLLGILWLTGRSLSEGRRRDTILAGVLLGLMFYTYYFYWVGTFGAIALLLSVLALEKDAPRVKRLLATAGLAVAIGLPYLVLVKTTTPNTWTLLNRISAATRAVSLFGILVIAAALAALVVLRRYQRNRSASPANPMADWIPVLCLALLGGAGVGLNFQVLSGRDANHAAHYHSKIIQPMLLMLVPWAVGWLEARRARLVQATSIAASVVLVGLGTFRQARVVENTRQLHRGSESGVACLRWARENIPPTKVLGTTDGRLIGLIPAMAGNFSFVPMAVRTNASDEEILTRYLITARLEGKTLDEAWNYLFSVEPHRMGMSYLLLGRATSYVKPHYRNVLADIWSRLDTSRAQEHGFQLDYLLLRNGASTAEILKRYQSADVVYPGGDWNVVQLGPPRRIE